MGAMPGSTDFLLGPERPDFVEVETSRQLRPMEKDPREMTVILQTFTEIMPMMISRHATLGELRDNAARRQKCHAKQVTLTLVADCPQGIKLRGDHSELCDCGFTDRCTVVVTMGEAEEHLAAQLKGLSESAMSGAAARSLITDVLDAAVQHSIISHGQHLEFKRSIGVGERKVWDQVLDQVLAATQGVFSTAEGDAFRNIIEKSSPKCKPRICKEGERNRCHAQRVAADNQQGLMMAASRYNSQQSWLHARCFPRNFSHCTCTVGSSK